MNPIFGDDDLDLDDDDDDHDDLDLDDDDDDDSDLDDDDDDDDDDDSDLDDDEHEEDSPAIVNPTQRSSLLGRLGISLHPCKIPNCASKCGDYVGEPITGSVCTNCKHLREYHGSFGL